MINSLRDPHTLFVEPVTKPYPIRHLKEEGPHLRWDEIEMFSVDETSTVYNEDLSLLNVLGGKNLEASVFSGAYGQLFTDKIGTVIRRIMAWFTGYGIRQPELIM
jgi:hypothetical protein